MHAVATDTHSAPTTCAGFSCGMHMAYCPPPAVPALSQFPTPTLPPIARRFHLWDAYGVLPTVCGIKDKAGGCTYAGVQAESSANCIMPLEAVIDRLGALKVGDEVCVWVCGRGGAVKNARLDLEGVLM